FAFVAFFTLDPLRALITLVALWTLDPRIALIALRTLNPLVALVALRSLRPGLVPIHQGHAARTRSAQRRVEQRDCRHASPRARLRRLPHARRVDAGRTRDRRARARRNQQTDEQDRKHNMLLQVAPLSRWLWGQVLQSCSCGFARPDPVSSLIADRSPVVDDARLIQVCIRDREGSAHDLDAEVPPAIDEASALSVDALDGVGRERLEAGAVFGDQNDPQGEDLRETCGDLHS